MLKYIWLFRENRKIAWNICRGHLEIFIFSRDCENIFRDFPLSI